MDFRLDKADAAQMPGPSRDAIEHAADHPEGHPGLNYLDIVKAQYAPPGAAAGSAPHELTKDELQSELQQADHIRIFSLNPDFRRDVEEQIQNLEPSDLKAISNIVSTIEAAPVGEIDATKKAQLDKIFDSYSCFPERLRNIVNPLNLILQRDGFDYKNHDPSKPQLMVEGGYPDYPDQTTYEITMHGDRLKDQVYKYTASSVCS